ncbi:MAG: serine hydrolase, partial [Patescibacteria group bacterium]
AAALLVAHPALAATPATATLDTGLAAAGYTLRLGPAAAYSFSAGVLSEPVQLKLDEVSGDGKPTPAGLKLVSGYYLYDAVRTAPGATKAAPIKATLTVQYQSDTYFRKQVYFWNGAGRWVPVSSVADTAASTVRAIVGLPYSVVAVFEDPRSLEGIASWYRSAKYPYGAATNNYPNGTKLRVTNTDNRKSVVVEVVSTGPFGKGRVIDLTLTAFKKIEEYRAGLARVQVEPVSTTAQVLGVDTSTLPAPAAPKLQATTAAALDVKTGSVIFQKNGDAVVPIASLTKLMTAAVFLDTNTPMDRVVAYQSSDITNPVGSRLYVSDGETMRVKDLYYSMLVGSANNATQTLVRSTGLSEAEFVRRMNEKAKSWELTRTTFVDVTGLGPANVSTAAEYVQLANRVMKDFRILQGTTVRQYSFTTINTGKLHTIKNTAQAMYGSSYTITGMKTGYLDEAGYCFTLKVRRGAGGSPEVVVAVLHSPTDAQRYRDATVLADYALQLVTR